MKKLLLGTAIVLLLVGAGVLVFRSLDGKGGGKADQERKIIALGDSISRANNLSTSFRGDNPEYSFSTGTKIESVYKYLKGRGENLKPVNLASSGATSLDVLTKQVPNVSTYHPKYITLLTGGPDLGTGVSVSEFKDNLREIIAGIKQEEAIILIGTLPNINRIRGGDYPSCKEDKIGLQMEKFTEANVKEFNKVIAEVAGENNLVLVELYQTLGPTDASDYDCLHPNIEGQKKLAQEWIGALK